MGTKISFSQLTVEVLPDGEHYMLCNSFCVKYLEKEFCIPSGFITDFASVPRLLWVIFPPFGVYTKAAVFHDWLYQFGEFTRAESDKAFLDAMVSLGVPIWKRTSMYYGVRLGGWRAWKEYEKQRNFLKYIDSDKVV